MLKDDVEHCDDDDFARVLQINIGAINTLNRALLPLMKQHSSVLYVGSTLSEKAVPGAFSYVVSKHAQTGLMRATCQDLMGRGIHTALICPGFTNTEMLRGHIGNDPEVMAAISNMNSFQRLIEPGEIAEMIVWCHANPVINGSVMHGNLGQQER
jgi:NAD(P)-dependent dehydrogenase (short-subunit alcohol dehydrogenase family)